MKGGPENKLQMDDIEDDLQNHLNTIDSSAMSDEDKNLLKSIALGQRAGTLTISLGGARPTHTVTFPTLTTETPTQIGEHITRCIEGLRRELFKTLGTPENIREKLTSEQMTIRFIPEDKIH